MLWCFMKSKLLKNSKKLFYTTALGFKNANLPRAVLTLFHVKGVYLKQTQVVALLRLYAAMCARDGWIRCNERKFTVLFCCNYLHQGGPVVCKMISVVWWTNTRSKGAAQLSFLCWFCILCCAFYHIFPALTVPQRETGLIAKSCSLHSWCLLSNEIRLNEYTTSAVLSYLCGNSP